MLPLTCKMEKIIDAILEILSQDVIVIIINCNMLYTFLGLFYILKELRIWLKNKNFP